MPERVEVPSAPRGELREQLTQLYRYLLNLSEVLNRNFQSIGGNDLTDNERAVMQGILKDPDGEENSYATLKRYIVETADYVQKTLKDYKESSLTDEVNSGKFGRYVMETKIQVKADPAGHNIEQKLIELLQKLKNDDISLRNYIYAGTIRTGVNGVAIGQNVVTFAQDGTEMFHPENAKAEITAEGIKGKVLNAVTTATDMNNVTEPGRYWLTMADMTHGPSDLSAKHEVQVTGDGTRINQRVYGSLSIYFRHYDGSSWGSWRKIEGTQV